MVYSLYFLGKEMAIETYCFFITIKCYYFDETVPLLQMPLAIALIKVIDRKMNELKDTQVSCNLSVLFT